MQTNPTTPPKSTFLVFGATGRTGKHFVSIVLQEGHKVIALVRNPDKVDIQNPNLTLVKGSITDYEQIDDLLDGIDFVINMAGDPELQKLQDMNTDFTKKLIPAMRRKGIKRFLYQAGGFSRPYQQELPFMFSVLKQTLVRFSGLLGQHRDNEGVINYLAEEAKDIDWVVHRASIISDAPSKGTLVRSETKNSLATFVDCAMYNYRTVMDDSAIHTCELSYYKE